jgi:hypothetical protein
MEEKLRECVSRFQDELLSKAAGLGKSRYSFKEQIVERILSLNPSENAEPRIKLVSIDVPKTSVHRIIKEQATGETLPQFTLASEGQASCWDIDQYKGELFVDKTHVTVLFWKTTTQEAIQQSFRHLLGATVELYAKALLWDESVAALEISVADTTLDGKKVPTCENEFENEFSHVTVWIAEDARAWMSNNLPKHLKEGKAQRIEFKAPVSISGSISFWDFENNPIPIEEC